jgi:hypothetical protein
VRGVILAGAHFREPILRGLADIVMQATTELECNRVMRTASRQAKPMVLHTRTDANATR